MPRSLDDATHGAITNMMFYNSMELVQHLQKNSRFLKEVFDHLKAVDATTDHEVALKEQRDLVVLLQVCHPFAFRCFTSLILLITIYTHSKAVRPIFFSIFSIFSIFFIIW
jgi:hypothetical protein